MEHRVRVPTSDHVELEFELAGVGSRFAAAFIDMVLIHCLILVAWLVGLVAVGASGARDAFAWALALLILFGFLTSTGYFVLFEGLTRGRTPGKRLLGLRVLRDDGVPIGWRAAVTRNLLRIVDLMPPPSGLLGILFMLSNRRGQRLGDLAAGTMVVRERFAAQVETESGAVWMERVEKGASRQAVLLPGGQLSVAQLTLIESFLQRSAALPAKQRQKVAWNLARPILPLLGEDAQQWEPRPDRNTAAEEFLRRVLSLAQSDSGEESASESEQVRQSSRKRDQWRQFAAKLEVLLPGGRRALRRLSAAALAEFLNDYRRLTADLARARSLGADPATVDWINRLAVQGHNVLYGHSRAAVGTGNDFAWLTAFARAVRRHPAAVATSALLLFGPALISSLAVLLDPQLGYQIVPDAFLDFSPARQDNLHEIPSLMRPVAASAILTNNLQVSLCAFAFGLTAGIGTALMMVFNGVHIGAVGGWLTHAGQQRAFWGWVMPHGGTEMLAIAVAGAAGCVLAEAVLSPGRLSRRAALKRNAVDALILEVGCMAMLVVAGLIEGFVSPSQLPYPARIAILAASLAGWLGYFALAGRRGDR